jgi:xanthine/CO dehydrogenase XdhC/CoxF family maturation factor
MKDLPGIADTIIGLTEPAALATLVRVTGSSYRKPGARMIFGAEGLRRGLISAGCLEADVLERLDSVLAGDKPQLLVYDMGSELDLVWGTGMGCEGKVEVLLERVAPGAAPAWMELCRNLLLRRKTGVVATVFATRGTGPTLGSGFILGSNPALPPSEPGFRRVLEEASAKALSRGTPGSVTLTVPGGEADVLLVPVLPPIALWIYGAGEPARPLAKMAHQLGWYVGIADHRPALATPERFPDADTIVVGPPEESLKGLPFDSRSAALILSHVYERDKEALALLLKAPLGYLGLQGNRKRCSKLLDEVARETGLSAPIVHAPAGLDLGAETPEAIGLSMLAEILATLSGRPGGSLRDREGPIHAN